MSVTQFTDAVEIEGSQDTTQLKVQGHTTQTEPLQTWEDDTGDPLARVTGDGRLQVGDDLGMETPDALIEAHRDDSSVSLPHRGVHTLGRIAGALSDAVQWVVGELEVLGSGAVSGVHSTLRSRLTHSSTGDSTEAELRAGDFEVSNQSGTPASRVGHVTALHAAVTNQSDGYLDEAVGLEVAVSNENPDETDPPINTVYGVRVKDVDQGAQNYALHTGKGTAHLGDTLELTVPEEIPTTAPANTMRIYPKPDGKLYARSDQEEYDLTGGEVGLCNYWQTRLVLPESESLTIAEDCEMIVTRFQADGGLDVQGRLVLLM
jgi:hypothetical protein